MATDIGTLRGTIELNDKFSSTLSLAGSNLQKAGRNFQAVGGKMSAAGSSITRSIGLPLALASGAALKLSSDFETSLTKIQTLVGLSAKDVQGFRADVLSLAGETAQAPKALADAMFFITSAGLRGAEALEALKFSAQASAIGLGDTAVVADAVTSAMNAYGPATLSAERATNVLALAVRAGKLEASALAPVLGRLLPTAAAMEIAFEDVAGVLAVMSKTGLDAAEASTSLSSIMTTLLKPTKLGVDALDSVGLSLKDLRETAKGPGGLVQVMRDLDSAFEGNDEALVQVVPNVRAFRGVMNVLAQDAGSVDEVMKAVASDVDVLGEGMKIVEQTTGFKFNQFMTKLSTVGIELGDTLVPAFEGILAASVDLLSFASKGVELFGKLPGPIQTTAIAFLGLAIAMGPIMFLGGNMLTMFGSLLGVMGGGLAKVGLFSKATGAIGTAGVSAGRGLGPLVSTILPGFMQKTVQGRNAAGQFTKGVTKLDLSFLKTKITLGSLGGAFKTMGVAIKGAAISLGTTMAAAASAAGTALSALWAVILANPIGAIAIAVGLVAVAVSSFVFKEGGMFENWMAGTKETLAELQTGVTNLTGSVATLGLGIADNMRDTFPEVTAAISAGVAAGKDMDTVVQDLLTTFQTGTVVGDALRASMIEVSTEMNAGARAATALRKELDDVKEAEARAAANAEALKVEQEELVRVLSSLGVVTRTDVKAGLDDLETGLKSGQVPAKKAAELLDKMWTELNDIGQLTPDVQARLLELARTHDTLKISQTANLAAMSELGRQFSMTAGEFEDNTPPIADFGDAVLPRMVPELDRATLGMKQFGITLPNVGKDMKNLTALVESGRAPVRQMVEAIRDQRQEYEDLGALTPEVNTQLRTLEKTALANATAADRAALGFKGLFDGLITGFGPVDDFIGKFGGIFDSITGVLGGLGGKVGGFFSGLTDSIGSMFGSGGKQGGDNFFANMAGGLGGLGGLFGKKGEESGTDFTQAVSIGVGGIMPVMTNAGTAGAGGFASGIMQTLGGGGGFDIGGMFNTSGQAATQGFTLGLSTVPEQAGSIFAEAANESGGGFLSTLSGLFGGGGGEGGGFLSSIFSGAGGGAGGNFLSGLTQGLSSGMGAAKSSIQGIFQAGLSLIPVVGPILSQFAGPLFKGITAIGKKIGGFFKGIFGGVSAEEKEARSFANSLNDVFRGMLDTASLAEAKAAAVGTKNDQWAVSNIAIRDSYLAVGMSADQAAAATTRLSASAKKSPAEAEAAAAAIKVVTDRVEAAMSITGLSLTKLRDQAITDASNMGISVEEAFTNLTTSVTESVTTATGVQCEAQTAAATCGVNSAEQVSSAVEVSTKKQVEDTKAAQEEIVTLTTDTGKKIVQGVADTTEVIQTKWEESTSATKAKLQDLQTQSDISFNAMAAEAGTSAEQIQLVLDSLFETTGLKLDLMAAGASSSFGSMAASAIAAARDSVDAFEDMEDELVGNSVFPDTAFSASKSLMDIAKAAQVSAGQVTSTFAAAGGEVEKKIGVLVATGGATKTVAMVRNLDRTVLGQPDLRSRAVRGGGGPPGGGGGGGSDMVVQVVMPNGQVLAETVVKEMPRVLGNKGLRRF